MNDLGNVRETAGVAIEDKLLLFVSLCFIVICDFQKKKKKCFLGLDCHHYVLLPGRLRQHCVLIIDT